MLREPDSLADMDDKEKLDALINEGYLRGNKWCECPSSGDKDYNDYTIIMQGNIVADIECNEKPNEHVWP